MRVSFSEVEICKLFMAFNKSRREHFCVVKDSNTKNVAVKLTNRTTVALYLYSLRKIYTSYFILKATFDHFLDLIGLAS